MNARLICIVCLVLLFLFKQNVVLADELLPKNPFQFNESLYSIVINDHDFQKILYILTDSNGGVWLKESDLIELRVKLPTKPPLIYQGSRYHNVYDIFVDTKIKIDPPQGKMFIGINPSLFQSSTLDLFPDFFSVPERYDRLGSYLNYDLLFSKDGVENFNSNISTKAFFELVFFNNFGTIANSFLLRNDDGSDYNKYDTERFMRLSSSWTYDDSVKMRRISLGDSVTSSGMTGTSVGFAGIQYSTNYSMQPGFRTIPLPTAHGEAAMPSTVDIYINNILNARRNVDTGPFTIQNIPIFGAADIKLVVTDDLGREKVISAPYYASSSMMRNNLNDFSFEAGFIRNNYNIESNDYGRFIVSGTETYGINNNLTGQIHTEITKDYQTLGLGIDLIAFNYFEVVGAIASSKRADAENGITSLLNILRNTPKYSYGILSQYYSKDYIPLAVSEEYKADCTTNTKLRNQVYFGLNNILGGSFSINYTQSSNWQNSQLKLFSASYFHPLFKRTSLIFTGVMNLGGDEKTKQIFLSLNTSLDNEVSASLSGAKDFNSEGDNLFASVSKNPPLGLGYGYRVNAAIGDENNRYISGALDFQTNYADIDLEAEINNSSSYYRADFKGALSLMKGQFFLSRPLLNSFGVIQVPGFSNIPIYLENQLMTYTDKKGYAFVPDLISYSKNVIAINPQDLPLNVNILSTKVELNPYARSGLFKEFSVLRTNNATLTLKMPDGKYVPSGAEAHIIGKNDMQYVGEKGLLFMVGLDTNKVNNIQVNIGNDVFCNVTVSYRVSSDPQPNLGEFTCSPKL